ncbi:Acyl-CoA thioesterase 2 [Austwickia sp. TVS 96-490-7B]|uniref:acyl-CoA thioesterase n=1 Tax=Austwickia sp. TVS 96-490-7B TaxID=2830843 RepID=UPI001C595129|nr:acyl-CoA thioesterase II [Austwickia sp. TVS 96-490-7B]MBW3086530.1 Acyl-CoA thioesterase 2 [Austwickia sp. TVS 96-490-7B]
MSFHEQYLTPNDPEYDPLCDLLTVLNVVPATAVDPVSAGAAAQGSTGIPVDVADTFVGRSQPMPHGRVFGGQVVAQALVAAGRTVADVEGPPRLVHSLHGYFLRPGDATQPLRFEVERLRDGASFSARRVHAVQYGQPILSVILSFQTHAGGIDHQSPMPPVPMPEDLADTAELLAEVPDSLAKEWTVRRPIDVRHCEGAMYVAPQQHHHDVQHVWMRAIGSLPDDPLIHAAVLAYASDYTILEGALRRHGLSWADERLRAASLDHAMWFHRPVRADEWILYAEESASASGGRALGAGRMFSRDGVMVASVAQEGMLRLKGY